MTTTLLPPTVLRSPADLSHAPPPVRSELDEPQVPDAPPPDSPEFDSPSDTPSILPEPSRPAAAAPPARRSQLEQIGDRLGIRRMSIALVVIVTATTAMFGSADTLPLALNGVMIFAFAIVTLALFAIPSGSARLASGAALLALSLAGWALIQAMPVPEWMAHPVWRVADEALGTDFGALSLAPARTAAAIVPLLIPFAVFLATLALATDDDAALRILRLGAYAGGLLGGFAILQFALAPETLLVIEKAAYGDSLTAPFVNRNTAATYYGAVALVSAGFLGAALAGDAETRQRMGGGRLDPRLTFTVIILVALMAVALTNSRAGLFSLVAAFVVAVPLMVMLPANRRVSRFSDKAKTGGSLRRLLIGAGAAFAVVAGALLIGGRSIWRLDVAGLADNRFCILPRTLDLAADNWLTGTGLGTFEAAYVAYRDPACGIYGAWDSAHNVYLDAFITLGIVAAPAILAVVVTLVAVFVSGIRKRHRMRAFPILGLALTVLVALHSLMDFSIEIAGFSAPFAMMTAATAAIALHRPKRNASAKD